MKELYGLYEKYTGKEPESVTSLTGSGSNRSYFRMSDGERSLMGVVGTDALENKAFITPIYRNHVFTYYKWHLIFYY